MYNEENAGKPFGKSPQAIINLSKYMTETKDIWKSLRTGETKSVNDAIFILTPTDLNKLVPNIDFWKYAKQL